MKTLQILSILIFTLFGASLQAQEDDNSGWVILYNEAQLEWHNVFPEMEKNLTRLRDRGTAQIHCTSIAPTGGWMTVYHSGRDPHSSYNKSWYHLRETAEPVQQLCDMKKYIKRVSFSPKMGWVVLYGESDAIWNKVPVELQAAILEVYDAKGIVNDVAFDGNNNWVVLSGKNTFKHSGVDSDLVSKMQELSQAGSLLKQVCFTLDGGWVLLYDNDKAAWKNVSASLHNKLTELNGAGREFKEVRIWTVPSFSVDGGPVNPFGPGPDKPTNKPSNDGQVDTEELLRELDGIDVEGGK